MYARIVNINSVFRITDFLVLDSPPAMRQTLALGNDDFARAGIYKTDLYWKPTAADKGTKVVCIEATDNYKYVGMVLQSLIF